MRKLLKYDMCAVLRGWWILSVAALGMSAIGGICLQILNNAPERGAMEWDMLVKLSAVAGVSFGLIALGIYGVASLVLVLRRFYCHFFTDEGYLTFTLPVSRRSLLNSKVLTAFFISLMTTIVAGVGVLILYGIGLAGTVDIDEFMRVFADMTEFFRDGGIFTAIYGAEAVLWLLVRAFFSALFPFLCITIGAIVARRHKVLTAIGIYFGGCMVSSLLLQIGMTVFFSGALRYDYVTYDYAFDVFAALLFLAAILIEAGLAVLFYCLTLRLLNRRLNLS